MPKVVDDYFREKMINEEPKIRICWRCGKYHPGLDTSSREYCENCKEQHKKEDKKLMDDYLEKKMRIMWRRAVNNLEKQGVDMDGYYSESQYVLELALENYNKFQSSPEMLVAMELLKNRIKAKIQYKVSKYRVDFLIPKLKVVLEVDGRLHDFKVTKDSNRDVAILNELNTDDSGWEVIRIPTKHVEKNIKQLLPAIDALYKERQKLRRKNGGFLPIYYSKHDTAQQLEVIKSLNIKENKTDTSNIQHRFNNEWDSGEL